MSTAAITVDHLSFRYADSERWTLRDISVSVAAGETVLILGPSGSGKSTLALCLNGLIPHEIDGEMQGEVRVWGQPAASIWDSSPAPLPPKTGGQTTTSSSSGGVGGATASPTIGGRGAFVGEVFQDPETQMVMPRLDEEVAFGLENLGVPPGEMPQRIAAALEHVGLLGRARGWIGELSGGQKQRLALAAVLALNVSILVLDEPTANQDPAATVAFFQNLARLKADLGMTIVLIEHRLDAAMPLIDRVVAINRSGQVLAQGTPAEVFGGYSKQLESEGIWLPMTCRLTEALRAHGWPIRGCPLSIDALQTELSSHLSARTDVASTGRSTTERSMHGDTPPPPAGDSTLAIDIRGLTFSYPAGALTLCNVNLQVQRGRFFALVGENGSGKTTLAKHLVGLLRPSGGSIAILGRDTRRQSKGDLARQAGYVFQNPEHQFVTERVADELAYSLRGRWAQEEIDRRVLDLLHTFGLDGYENENPFALSQGQKRRLSVATMVALDQPILILDEPTFGQDQQSTAALMSTLKALHDAGTTILFTTHDMQLVAEYADAVAVMKDGQVFFHGSPRDLFRSPDILQETSLTVPPLVELSRRLGLPPLLTVEEWVQWADPQISVTPIAR